MVRMQGAVLSAKKKKINVKDSFTNFLILLSLKPYNYKLIKKGLSSL
jgi:hypothetical protein